MKLGSGPDHTLIIIIFFRMSKFAMVLTTSSRHNPADLILPSNRARITIVALELSKIFNVGDNYSNFKMDAHG